MTGSIEYPPELHLPETESILDLDQSRSDHLRIYSLPECCWPDQTEVEGLLPNRSEKPIYSGLDAMVLDSFALLRHRRFALLTNATGRNFKLEAGLELMYAQGVGPALLLEPEHGLYGSEDEIARGGLRREARYGTPIVSLYAQHKRPPERYLRDLDLIVVDIKNLPVRCYTYASTLTYIMEVAHRLKIEVMILDRSHPYGFFKTAGSFLDSRYRSFVGEAPLPFLYALSPGEYARYLQAVRLPQLRLSIVTVSNFERRAIDAAIRGAWINPSPNIPSYESALVYPGLVFLEGVNYSLGRGTTRPFIYSGAPWVESDRLLARLQALQLPGVELAELSFKPLSSNYAGQLSHGIQITPTSIYFDPIRTGYEYIRVLRHMYPAHFRYRRSSRGGYFIDQLWGSDEYRKAIENNLDYADFRASWQADSEAFDRIMAPLRLY
ncbi:MAG: DUF1343 domain-containing protein [Leptospiraceae bacterium]|nr:DUF1343 domain-containing protein [Leptospiraceae bacterium]